MQLSYAGQSAGLNDGDGKASGLALRYGMGIAASEINHSLTTVFALLTIHVDVQP